MYESNNRTFLSWNEIKDIHLLEGRCSITVAMFGHPHGSFRFPSKKMVFHRFQQENSKPTIPKTWIIGYLGVFLTFSTDPPGKHAQRQIGKKHVQTRIFTILLFYLSHRIWINVSFRLVTKSQFCFGGQTFFWRKKIFVQNKQNTSYSRAFLRGWISLLKPCHNLEKKFTSNL